MRGGARGWAPVEGKWFNPAPKGRSTLPEVVLAACCIVGTSRPEEQRLPALLRAVELEQARAKQMGDAWTGIGDAWTRGGVVQTALKEAYSPKEEVLVQAVHVLHQHAEVSVSTSQLRTYLRRISDRKARNYLDMDGFAPIQVEYGSSVCVAP